MTKKLIVVLCACVVLALAGMIAYLPKEDNDKTIAASNEENGYERVHFEIGDEEGVGVIFDEKYYSCYENENDSNIAYVERIKDRGEIPGNQLFTESDVNRIMGSVLGTKYDIERAKIEDTVGYNKAAGGVTVSNIIMYDELKDGYPTGTSMSIILDEEGYISYLTLRKGASYDTQVEKMISKREAFDKAVEATKEKYNNLNLEFNVEYSEDKINTFYYPPKKCLCYTFDFEGAIEGKWDDELSVFVFTPIINAYDSVDIDIASTLGY